ncbi:MAG: nucleoside monophosphate kinase [Patescibacteria group bacterium]|jgi:adenylate kinase
MPYKIIVYGLPGAGKDTQCEALARILGIPHFSTGQILRDEIAKGSELGLLVKPYVESGTMIPKGVATNIYKEKLLSPEIQNSGYIVNGYPRSVESLKTYFEFDQPTHFIHLVIPDELARKRLIERGRADDVPEVIENRIKRYYETEKAAAEYAREYSTAKFIEIDSSAPTEEVTKILIEHLK